MPGERWSAALKPHWRVPTPVSSGRGVPGRQRMSAMRGQLVVTLLFTSLCNICQLYKPDCFILVPFYTGDR